jgi:hypothetical protein
MRYFQHIVAIAICMGILVTTNDADALIVSGNFTGVINSNAEYPLFVEGQPIHGDFAFNSALGTSFSWLNPPAVNPSEFAFSVNGASYAVGSWGDNSFSVSSNELYFASPGGVVGFGSLDLNVAVPLSLLYTPGSYSLAAANMGTGTEIFGECCEATFNIDSISLSSSPSPVSDVPLPATLPLFCSAIAIVGAFLLRLKISRAEPIFV